MSFPRYPKYKDSGVEWLGEVPEHWVVTATRAIVEERVAKNLGAANGDYLSLMANVGIIPYADKGDIGNKKPEDLSKCKVVSRGDLVINSMNYGIGSYGISGYDGVCSSVYIVLTIREGIAEPRFAFRVFENKAFQGLAQSFGNGILEHRAAIHWGTLKRIGVALPARSEQRAILAFLDRETSKIDELVAEQQRLMELLKEKRQAVISHAVTKGLNPDAPMKPSGVEWLGEVPAHWEVGRLKHFITRIEQGASPQCLSDPAVADSWGVLKVGCVNGDTFNPDEQKGLPVSEAPDVRFEVLAGDILMSRGNTLELVGSVSFVSVARPKLLISDLLYRFRPNSQIADGAFLALALRTKEARFQIESSATGTSASMKKISQGDIKELLVACPPVDEQRQIVAHLHGVTQHCDLLNAAAFQAAVLLGERRSALISAAVTGQIDVRHLATAEAA